MARIAAAKEAAKAEIENVTVSAQAESQPQVVQQKIGESTFVE